MKLKVGPHPPKSLTQTSTPVEERGSPIPLLKTVSHVSNRPFHASRKMQKTPSHSQKKASNHVERFPTFVRYDRRLIKKKNYLNSPKHYQAMRMEALH